jgi:hypothetical protein
VLRRAIAGALTGTQVTLPEASRWNAAALVSDLAAAGWNRERISEVATAATVWPFPGDLADGVGPAQYAAALRQVRSELGLDGLAAPVVSTRSDLTADERRLMADVPPHYR